MRRLLRLGLRVTILCGLVFLARRWWEGRESDEAVGDGWTDRARTWDPPPVGDTTGGRTGAPAAVVHAPSPAAVITAEAAATLEVPRVEATPTVEAAATGEEAPAVSATPSAETRAAEAASAAEETAPTRARRAAKRTTKPKLDEVPRIWVEPVGTTCPPDHPVKVKMASRLFRVPGMFAYERTKPDRCYPNEDGAIADGFTRAQR